MVRGTAPSRLAAQALAGPLLFTDSDVWAYFRLAPIPLDYRSPGEAEGLANDVAVGLAGLAGCQVQLLAVPCHYPVEEWAEQLDASVYDPAPGWADHLAATADHLGAHGASRKLVYLGVRLGTRERATPQLSRLLRLVDATVGHDDPAVSEQEQQQWQRRADHVARIVRGGALGATPATAEETAWLLGRSIRRGLPEPRPSASDRPTWGRGEVEQLVDGEIERHPYMLRLMQRDGEAWVAWLSAARLPQRLPFAGGSNAWLALHDQLPWPVDLCCRWEVVEPHRARGHVSKRLAALRDQEQHTASSGGDVSQALDEDIDLARHLEAALTKDRTPLIYGHARWAVTASDPDTLAARCDELLELYRAHGIDLAWPPYDQQPLQLESLPGDHTRLNAYRQRQDVQTIGGGLPTATGDLGDDHGPYLGYTTKRIRSVVCFDGLAAPRANRESSIAFAGTLGGGKTTAACTVTMQAVLRGASAMVIEPKGDTAGLANLPGIGESRVIDLGAGEPGLLDPFALADSPDEAARMAADVLGMMLPPGASYDQHTTLLRACHEEAHQHEAPSLHAVVERLAAGGEEISRGLALNLRAVADLPTARVCFAPAAESGGHLDPQGQLTIVHAAGLDLPDPGTPHDQMKWSERLSLAVMYLVADSARRLCRRRDRHAPKAILIDEAWMLTSTDTGRKLVPELARLGRSYNTALLLSSQNAGDLLDESVRNCIGAVFAFRSHEANEVRAVETLLGVESDSGVAHDLPSLEDGECIVRDLAGRIGRMQVDLSYDPQLQAAFDTTPDPVSRHHQNGDAHADPDNRDQAAGEDQTDGQAAGGVQAGHDHPGRTRPDTPWPDGQATAADVAAANGDGAPHDRPVESPSSNGHAPAAHSPAAVAARDTQRDTQEVRHAHDSAPERAVRPRGRAGRWLRRRGDR